MNNEDWDHIAESLRQHADLVMLLKVIIAKAQREKIEWACLGRAVEYLKRKELYGDPTREYLLALARDEIEEEQQKNFNSAVHRLKHEASK